MASLTAGPGSDEISRLISGVVEASKLPPKSRTLDVKPAVATLTSLSYQWGLLPDALDSLVDLVTRPSHLDQASLAAIVRNLYPVAPVSRNVVLRVVSCLGHGKLKPSLTLQAALLRWLIMIYHVLETPNVLAQVYPVLFNLLDTSAIRPHLSHLLALATRRKHVRPFRIQYLLKISRQTGKDQYIIGLLRVFKDYYPEVIVGDAVKGRASAFKHPDLLWRQRLDEIQEAHAQQAEGHTRTQNGFRVNRPVGRSQRNKLFPLVHTSHATENSVTVEEIENVDGFVNNLDKLELPNQLVAVLADPMLQKLLLLRPSPEVDQRIANWLDSVLQDVLDGDVEESVLFDVLDVLRDYVVSTKKLPPLVLNFLARFLPVWNGTGRRDSLFEVLSYAPLHDFAKLYKLIFQPLEAATLDDTPSTQLALLNLYSNLLHYWTVLLKSNGSSVPESASTNVTALVRHVNSLALTLVQTSPTISACGAVLDFYEQTTRLVTDDALKHYIRIELPPSMLIYILLFDSSLAIVSRLCNVLACYKKGFEMAMLTKARSNGPNSIDASSYNRDYVNLYNGYLMDICNCFWRGRAFTGSDTNSHGCMVPRALIATLTTYVTSVDKTFTLANLFGLSYSPILSLQSIRLMRRLEDEAMAKNDDIRVRHAGPVTQTSLTRLSTMDGMKLSWQDYRINVLATLSAVDLEGITELLKNTMTVLRNSLEAKNMASKSAAGQ